MPPNNQNCPLTPSKFHPSFFSYQANGRITTLMPQCSPLCPHCRAFDAHRWLSESLGVNGRVDPMRSASSISLEQQAMEGLADFKKSCTSARKTATDHASKQIQTDCPSVERSSTVGQIEVQPTGGNKTTEKRIQITAKSVPKSTKTTNRVSKSASKFAQTKPVWLPPRSDGHSGPARRRRLLLKFETRKGKIEYAELLDIIEMKEQGPSVKLKLRVNFKEGTIRTRYSVSGVSGKDTETEQNEQSATQADYDGLNSY